MCFIHGASFLHAKFRCSNKIVLIKKECTCRWKEYIFLALPDPVKCSQFHQPKTSYLSQDVRSLAHSSAQVTLNWNTFFVQTTRLLSLQPEILAKIKQFLSNWLTSDQTFFLSKQPIFIKTSIDYKTKRLLSNFQAFFTKISLATPGSSCLYKKMCIHF